MIRRYLAHGVVVADVYYKKAIVTYRGEAYVGIEPFASEEAAVLFVDGMLWALPHALYQLSPVDWASHAPLQEVTFTRLV